jgi:hypothetical protein
VRGFIILSVSVLLVIGAGVAVISTQTPEGTGLTGFNCPSVESCLGDARAWGISAPLLVPTDRKLAFDVGWVSWMSPDEWGMSFTYKEKYHGEPWALLWQMGTWGGEIHCRKSGSLIPLVVRGGLDVCYIRLANVAAFEAHDVTYLVYVSSSPATTTPLAKQAWLIKEIAQRRTL